MRRFMRFLIAAALVALAAACAKREAERPPLILISIDTLRADRVTPATTPNLTALMRESLVYRNAWSHCPLTLPSHLSMFTGLLPPEHGVRDNVGYRFDGHAHPTLAATLRRAGYATGGAVSAYVLRAATGVADGFDDYDDAIGIVDGAPVGSLQRSGTITEAIAEKWIAAPHTKPFFYFLHLYEPHTPYEPTYDADVMKADAIAGKFIAFLRERKLFERALIVVVSDHGEGLNEHGEAEHGVFVYREALQVPLIIKLPNGREAKTVDAPVQLADVMPTILAAAHVAAPKTSGRSLLDSEKSSRPLYAESLYPRIHLGWSELRSIVRNGMHVIDAPQVEVYDLARDPHERANVADAQRRAASEARAEASRIGGAFAAPEAIDPEEAKKLAALGYVSAGSESGGALPDPKSRIGDLARLKKIAELQRQGKNGAAIAAMEQLLAANPQWSDVRDQLGAAYDASGDHAKAAHIYEDGIRATPRLASQFALAAATSLAEGGDLAAAESHARLALAGDPAGAHLLLGELALTRGALDAAANEATAAGAFATQRAHATFLDARIAAARHDEARALQLCDEVRRLAAASGESLPQHFHSTRGDLLAHVGRPGEAEEELRQAVAEDAEDAEAWRSLALVRFIAGNVAAGEETLDRYAAALPEKSTYVFAERCMSRWGTPEKSARWAAMASRAR